ncbi:AAA family ATPase [Schlesneria sp. DSM 10557]|uniref:AAA family ATPase n=1 Tax=Schlesneria sp. DSM 10557 TaxID=3044399 RepID=UPI0035A04A1E
MKLLQKIGNLKEFAALPPKAVEQELAAIIRGEQTAGLNKLEHLGETVFERVRKLVAAVGRSFHSRDREIEAVAAGFISGVPVLLLGPPGTAKSAVVRKLASLCGLASGEDERNGAEGNDSLFHGGYFEYLLTNHTMPEELFGGPDLAELAKGKIKKVTTGKLPRAEIAFLDEVFRGGGHILNTLLTIINEKRFDSGDGAIHVPLLGLVGASNDIPREQDLEAFFDRFPVRAWMQSVLESRQKAKAPNAKNPAAQLINLSVDAEKKRLADAWDVPTTVKERLDKRESCTNDFRFARMLLLQRLADTVDNSPRFEQFERLFRAVRDRARLSDRSFGQLWLFAAALDRLRRSDDPNMGYPNCKGHLEVFRYVARSPQDSKWLDDVVIQHMQGLQHNGVV